MVSVLIARDHAQNQLESRDKLVPLWGKQNIQKHL